jgi:tetratricopeptide (TPR) repeat protein
MRQLKFALMVLPILLFVTVGVCVAQSGAGGVGAAGASDAMIKSFLQEGFKYVDDREYKKAVKSFKKAVELGPELPGTHYALGIGFKFLKDYDSAIMAQKMAINIAPEFAEAHFELGRVFDALKKPVFSAEHFYWAANIFLNTNRRDDALGAYANLRRIGDSALAERIFERLYPILEAAPTESKKR